MSNYLIVLFKNKKKKKILKRYVKWKNANPMFTSLVKDNKIPFEMQYENGEKCEFELALVSNKDKKQEKIYKTDELGRNIEVFMMDEGYVIKKIVDYKVEEKIYDWDVDDRITFHELINNYCDIDEIKTISTLHNKLVIQINANFYLFSLKTIDDANRLIDAIENFYREEGKSDAIFVRDTNTIHRKWMYDTLEKYGFDRKRLYKQHTTFVREN